MFVAFVLAACVEADAPAPTKPGTPGRTVGGGGQHGGHPGGRGPGGGEEL